ncbi:MAG: TIM barrel protein [Anaerolineae bacterium]|nr:TIM barrel protein [Anaerolineae bacterium]
MMKGFAAGLWVFAESAEKFGSYVGTNPVRKQIEMAASVPGLKGVELISPLHIDLKNARDVKGWLDDAGLEPVSVNPYVWTEPTWKYGAFTSPDPTVRQQAIDRGKEAVEIGHIIGARRMCLWPGEDGWDYHFQADYRRLWELEAEGVRQIALHDPETRIGVEYKLHEPRTHMLISNAAKAALLGEELGLPNVGGYLDFGHALMAREVAAESVVVLARRNRLMGVHVNDNYGLGDDDIVVGSVHFWEMVEFLLTLDEVGYDGWLTLDLVPKREEVVAACAHSIHALQVYLGLIKHLDRAALRAAQADMDALKVQRLIHDMLGQGVPA